MYGRCTGLCITFLVSSLIIVGCCWSAAVAATDVEPLARRVEGKLMAPCCMAGPVADHNSSISFQMRDEIRSMLRQGQSEQEILDFYVAQYGPQILALPEARGFNLTAYLLPALMILVAGGGLALALKKWRASAEPSTIGRPVTAPPTVEPEYLERLQRELRDFD